jgi:putative acetyltransferase
VQTEIRAETRRDHDPIRRVVGAAFSDQPRVPDLVDLLRDSPGFVPELSLVALTAGGVVGHVMLTRAEVLDDEDVGHGVLVLSPLSVDPPLQRQGIGTALVRAGLAAAESLGERMVLLQGSPAYYRRFGFRDCRTLGIEMKLPDWSSPDAGMAFPLSAYDPAARGRFVDPPAFAAIE